MSNGSAAEGFALPKSMVVRFALRMFFPCASKFPRVMRWVGLPLTWVAVLASGKTRRNVGANMVRIRGEPAGRWRRLRFAQDVLRSFYDFVVDVALLSGKGQTEVRDLIEGVRGEEQYLASRRRGKGAVIVTGHMGSFEVGLAALSTVEPAIHVVFKRDLFAGFEKLRSEFRTRMGIREAAIDDGWSSLMQMRDALSRDEVVVVPGDRAYPGQRCMNVPVASGSLRLPVGPVTLARIVGSPIIPIFTTRSENGRSLSGRFVVHIMEPIDVEAEGETGAMLKLGRAIESMVCEYPEQWLVLQRAFVEDEE